MASDRLSLRALNRATLDRQWLLDRRAASAYEAITHLVAMQAQIPNAPYVGLWSRLAGFAPADLVALHEDRQVVRIPVLRNTVHLVTAADALVLRPWTQVIYDRDLDRNFTHGPPLRGVDRAELAAAGRALVEDRPYETTELGRELSGRWPDVPVATLAFAVRNLLPCVQVPPRGLWGRGGRPTLTTTDAWLGRPPGTPEPGELVLRYLRAYGPASVKDVQTWCGLTRLGEVVEALGDRVRAYTGEDGRVLYDPADATRPDPDVPAPTRYLPEFDNVRISYADRTRVTGRDAPRDDFPRGIVLDDGFPCATWRLTVKKRAAELAVTPYARLPRPVRARVEAEGEALVSWATPDADTTAVQLLASE